MRADKSLSPFEIRLYRHYRIVHGMQPSPRRSFLPFCWFVCFLFPGTWPLITLVVIMGPISFWGNVVPRAFGPHRRYDHGAALEAQMALRTGSFLTADAGVVCDSDVFIAAGWP